MGDIAGLGRTAKPFASSFRIAESKLKRALLELRKARKTSELVILQLVRNKGSAREPGMPLFSLSRVDHFVGIDNRVVTIQDDQLRRLGFRHRKPRDFKLNGGLGPVDDL